MGSAFGLLGRPISADPADFSRIGRFWLNWPISADFGRTGRFWPIRPISADFGRFRPIRPILANPGQFRAESAISDIGRFWPVSADFSGSYTNLYITVQITSYVVLQGRNIHKNLSKVVWFFVGKKGLRGQIWGNLFWDICDKFYLQKLWLEEFFYWIIKSSQKVPKTTHFGGFWYFLTIFDYTIKKLFLSKFLLIKFVINVPK